MSHPRCELGVTPATAGYGSSGEVAVADDITCPDCASEDLLGKPEGSAIRLSCQACGHAWLRQPPPICPVCGTGEPSANQIKGWQYDDVESARDDTMAA